MATKFYFNNKQITLPGAYSTITSGDSSSFVALDYGRVLLIDTGSIPTGSTSGDPGLWGGGKGIVSQSADGSNQVDNGLNAVYRFNNLADFQSFVGGGMYWKWAEALFNPDPLNPAAQGISELLFVRACGTTPSTVTYTCEGSNPGTFTLTTKEEGLGTCTGEETQSVGVRAIGYMYEIAQSSAVAGSYVMKAYKGSFNGYSVFDNLSISEISNTTALANPTLVWQSQPFTSIDDLIPTLQFDTTFNSLFTYTTTGTISTPITQTTAITGFGGGKSVYDSSDLTFLNKVLSTIADIDYNVVVTDVYGGGIETNTKITAIRNHINNVAKFPHQLYLAGGTDNATFGTSLASAKALNSDRVVLVHGDVYLFSTLSGNGYRWWGSEYNMFSVVGRTLGKPPYIPVTNKTIGVDGLKFLPNMMQQEVALQAGLITLVPSTSLGRFVVLQGVNTLQDNSRLFNAQGQSFSIQFMRIVDQINKELVVNAELDLLSDENGVNVNTLSPGVLKNWTANYLQSRVATPAEDNLILGFERVSVVRKEDAYFINYYIRVNNEINKLFFTGFLLK